MVAVLMVRVVRSGRRDGRCGTASTPALPTTARTPAPIRRQHDDHLKSPRPKPSHLLRATQQTRTIPTISPHGVHIVDINRLRMRLSKSSILGQAIYISAILAYKGNPAID